MQEFLFVLSTAPHMELSAASQSAGPAGSVEKTSDSTW
jgi:hypothetical protein